MFAKGKAIREAKKAEILAKATQEGIERGAKQTAKRSNANLRALAKKYDIPEDDLPFLDEDV